MDKIKDLYRVWFKRRTTDSLFTFLQIDKKTNDTIRKNESTPGFANE